MIDLSQVKRVVLPDWRENKFVQIYVNGEPFFRFAGNSSFHACILEEFLKELEIGFVYILDKDGIPILSPKGQDYESVGMGRIKSLDDNPKEFLLYDKSRDYNLIPNPKHLDDLAVHLPEGIKLRILG